MLAHHARDPGYLPLFWRLFLPNAAVLAVASLVLVVAPPRGRVLIVLGGLVVILVISIVLMRHACGPLGRLVEFIHRVDPLAPGRRLQLETPRSEVSELAGAFNAMLDRVETERRESARRERGVEQAERRRLARELHDEVGQCLTALKLQLERAGRALPPPMADDLSEARTMAEETLETVRRLAEDLRPEALDDLGLVSAVTALSDRLSRQTGVRVQPRLTRRLPSLSREQELVVYRVAQEAVTNAIRHAGGAPVDVALEPTDGGLRLAVTDAGPGLEDNGDGGTGIRGMRERALLIGANLSVLSEPGAGVEVRLEVPLNGAAP